MLAIILTILIICFAPFFCSRLTTRLGTESWLSPVVLSYAVGILFANLDFFPIPEHIAQTFVEATVLLAIPLLLYSTDILGWFRYAKSTLLSFGLCILSGLLCSFLAAHFYQNTIPDTPILAGMIVGVYTGGIPNMNAIGFALDAPQSTFIYLNAADILCGGVFLIFLTSVAPKIYSWFLPKFEQASFHSKKEVLLAEKPEAKTALETSDNSYLKINLLLPLLKSLALTIFITALTLGITYSLTGALKSMSLIILLLTTLSVFASLSPNVRAWKGSYEAGDYLLLMFCVAIGMLANFSNIGEAGGEVILFMGSVLTGTVLLHLFLSWLFKIDRDTTMITSTAALYGPPFIGQIARVIQNRTLVLSGMATGLVGYAIGNFLGIWVARILGG